MASGESGQHLCGLWDIRVVQANHHLADVFITDGHIEEHLGADCIWVERCRIASLHSGRGKPVVRLEACAGGNVPQLRYTAGLA